MDGLVERLLTNLWFDWLLLTFIYLLTFFTSGEPSSPFHVLNPLVGLFVPIGLFNSNAMFQPANPGTLPATSYAWAYVMPLLFIGLFFGNLLGKKCIPWTWMRPLLNLAILFLLTMCTDLIIWHKWMSYRIFAQAAALATGL